MKKINSFSFLIIVFGIISCSPKVTSIPESTTTFYQEQIKLWQKERVESVTAADGWMSLIGLYWLKEGENSYGSSQLNPIVFPDKTPSYIGTFTLENSVVSMKVNEKVAVKVGEDTPKEMVIAVDKTGNPTTLQLKSLSWYIINREDRFGVRLRDAKNDAIKKFKGIPTFEIDQNWQIPAYLRPAKNEQTIMLRNVIDMDVTMKLEGYLVFEVYGIEYELEAMDGGKDSYFVIFADETTGETTYGAGRYIYIPRVDDARKTLIDFNKAYNPPCAFTDFATCPLPSAKNQLDLMVTAGEKDYKKK